MPGNLQKYLFAFLLASGPAITTLAAEGETAAIYATICEPIKDGEAKSSARVRATDKACFKAVEKISQLQEYRNQYPTHDFNVMVYKIVDNYLEDLTIRTTEQDAEQLCVEVTGYLQEKNIKTAIAENMQKHEQETSQYPEALDIEDRQAALQPIVTELPPKPEITIKKEIAAEEILDETHSEHSEKTRVWVEPTEFFNKTSTSAFAEEIKQALRQEKDTSFAASEKNADYILKSKVLRAKVDPINSQTNRLQMVIAVELVNTRNKKNFLEHQNRFILFESSEDEQIVANSLMKKLLRQAVKNIAAKIENSQNKPEAIITPPAAANYSSVPSSQAS